ncbi:MAG: Spo0E family sporulation regulatory protein-aspartic acid phosphatase [Limnochordales bacterium]|nr:Spo0E family sporulation regulatory protein-aspartic acid phosphatase [Limnochordales bacterium]
MQRLGKRIEDLRRRLYRLADEGSEKEWKQINEELDRLILEFTRLTRNK